MLTIGLLAKRIVLVVVPLQRIVSLFANTFGKGFTLITTSS